MHTRQTSQYEHQLLTSPNYRIPLYKILQHSFASDQNDHLFLASTLYKKPFNPTFFKITLQKASIFNRMLTNHIFFTFFYFYPYTILNLFRTSVYYRSDKILHISTSLMCTNRKTERKYDFINVLRSLRYSCLA